MNPFKRLSEIKKTIEIVSKKHSRKATLELKELRIEAERLRKIIDANPCLSI